MQPSKLSLNLPPVITVTTDLVVRHVNFAWVSSNSMLLASWHCFIDSLEPSSEVVASHITIAKVADSRIITTEASGLVGLECTTSLQMAAARYSNLLKLDWLTVSFEVAIITS